MDLERLAKELHGEAPATASVQDQDEDPYADDNYAQRA